MAKTLLELVQDVLVTIDSDPVNSISDTYESLQIANFFKTEYDDFVAEYGLPSNQTLGALEAYGSAALPTILKLPDRCGALHWIKYDVRLEAGDDKNYRDLIYKDPKDFVDMCNQRPSTDTTNYMVCTMPWDANVTLTISKLDGPHYWTTFDNKYVVCDSYDSGIDTTLQQSKTQAFYELAPTFSLTDTFVPTLPENLYPLYYRTVEATAYAVFKQSLNPKLERKERMLRVRAQRNKFRVDEQQTPFKETPDYGR